MDIDTEKLKAPIAILQVFIATLMDTGMGMENAANHAFDLALKLVQFNAEGLPEMAAPHEANQHLQSALLLKTAMERLASRREAEDEAHEQ